MLVLLIIFMVVTPALAQGFKATPPDGINIKTHPEEDTDQVLGIAVDGSYWLNKRPIAEDTLDETIKKIYEARTVDKILYIKADKNLKYKFVAKAMDIAAKTECAWWARCPIRRWARSPLLRVTWSTIKRSSRRTPNEGADSSWLSRWAAPAGCRMSPMSCR